MSSLRSLKRATSWLGHAALERLPARWADALVLQNFCIRAEELEGYEVRLARTVDEYVAAARLVHDCYVGRGLITPQALSLRLTPYLAMPTTAVFVAERDGELVGTLSLVLDNALGLPMEKVFPDEVGALRSTGRRLAEVGALCIKPGDRGLGVTFLLYKLMWKVAEELLDVDDLVITVSKTMVPLYRGLLLFERMGPNRHYPGLTRNALTLGAPLRMRVRECWDHYQTRFGHLPLDERNPYHVYGLVDHPQIVMPASAPELEHLRYVRRQAAVKLAALRPDIVLELDDDAFDRFQREVA